MVFPILGANSASGEYEISNSLRFNNDDSPHLVFTPSSAGNRRTFTLSVWFKLSNYSTGERVIFAADDGTDSNNNFDYIAINGNDKIFVYNYEGSEGYNLISTQVLRDDAAWYHLVVAFDTTQSTASNRIKVYLNGSQVTAFDTENYPSENFQTRFNNTNEQRISQYPDQDISFFDGYMSEYHFLDGVAYDPSYFGETNTNGVWVPKQYTGGNYGTNGFFLEFKQTGTSANSSGMGADTSGNDNHFATGNLAAQDVTEDTPTNNFATFSSTGRVSGTVALLEGNCRITGNSSANASGQHGTIAFTSGKWYLEMKATDSTTTQLGFLTVNSSDLGDNTADGNGGMNYHFANIYYQYNNSSVNVVNTGGGGISAATVSGGSNSSLGGFSDGDILMFALDMDNNRAYFGKNGTWFNSANPATATNYFSLQTDVADGVTFYAGVDSCTGTELNTGNPTFSISSGNSDANGYGNFEYAVPSGYYAMCTKNLAEFG